MAQEYDYQYHLNYTEGLILNLLEHLQVYNNGATYIGFYNDLFVRAQKMILREMTTSDEVKRIGSNLLNPDNL